MNKQMNCANFALEQMGHASDDELGDYYELRCY